MFGDAFTGIKGFFAINARVVAALVPINKDEIKPGRCVTAIPSMLSIVTSASFKAFSITGRIFPTCSRAATSGTTPPVLRCKSIWDAIIFERTIRPSSTTAAAVSSQDVSIPRINMDLR